MDSFFGRSFSRRFFLVGLPPCVVLLFGRVPLGEVNSWDVWAGVWRYLKTIVGFRLSGCVTDISAIEWRYSGQKECELWKVSEDQAAPSLSEGS